MRVEDSVVCFKGKIYMFNDAFCFTFYVQVYPSIFFSFQYLKWIHLKHFSYLID